MDLDLEYWLIYLVQAVFLLLGEGIYIYIYILHRQDQVIWGQCDIFTFKTAVQASDSSAHRPL